MFNPLSLAAVKVSVITIGRSPLIASGFLYRFAQGIWLVSNWHVFSGRNADTGEVERGVSTPERIQFDYAAIGPTAPIRRRLDLPLFNAETGEASWIQHPNGREVDIAAIKVEVEAIPPFEPMCFNQSFEQLGVHYYPDIGFGIGSDVFIIGFPKVGRNPIEFPIWKRGTVASEPRMKFDGRDCFLVDSRTSSGMSGSPVIFHANGNFISERGENIFFIGFGFRIVGVYSGRYFHPDGKAVQVECCKCSIDGKARNSGIGVEISRVWPIRLVDEMLRANVRGRHA